MKTTTSLVLPARIENLAAFIATARKAADLCGVEEERFFAVELALEEALVNIINHAYEGEEGFIRITCGTDNRRRFVMEIKDKGKPFDITTVPPPDLAADMESRKIGGLGVHFVRSLMDEVTYRREKGQNILELSIVPVTGAIGLSGCEAGRQHGS